MKVLDKFNYDADEIPVIKMNINSIETYNGNVSIEVIHIFDYYDEVFNIDVPGEVKDYNLECAVNHQFEAGYYAIKTIRINDELIFGCNDKFDVSSFDYFTFLIEGIKKNYDLAYKEIINSRENEFFKRIDIESDVETSLFDAYIFVKNIKVKNRIQYGNIEAIPYESLDNDSEANSVDMFFKRHNVALNLSHIINVKNRPTAVFYVSNIAADEGRKAELLAIDMAERLISAFTLTTRGNGEIYAIAMLNKSEQTSCVNVLNRIYTGDWLLMADQGFTIRKYYEAFMNNSPLKFYVQLFHEAVMEHKRLYKYYKLWIILEELASTKNYSNQFVVDWNGNIEYDENGSTKKIDHWALENVFELVRNHFSNESNDVFISKTQVNITRKDFLRICYQRRCCCAHHGRCDINDSKICKSHGKYKLCRDNNMSYGFYGSKYDDEILVIFENLVSSILHNEIEIELGDTKKEYGLVESILKRQNG